VLHQAWVDAPEDQQTENALLALLDEISNSYAIQKGLLQEFEQHKELNLQEALVTTLAIPTSTIYEQYFQEVLLARIQLLMQLELDEGTWDTIRMIASECYDIGGPAVYLAPRLLDRAEQIDYLDINPCDEELLFPDFSNPLINSIAVLLSPNPASKSTQLQFKEEQGFNGTLALYDLWGRLLLKQKLVDAIQFEINLDNFNPGIYLIQLQNNHGDNIELKLVVQ
jgi:hypothetical protein